MDNETFAIEMDKSISRSKCVLHKKGIEYTEGEDRLGQFYRAAAAQGIPPTQALMGMAMKHITSLASMVKNPENFSLKKFDEKVVDIRNYTILLDALLRDMGIC